MDPLIFYIGYAILATMTLIAGAAWQITGGERAGLVARALFFLTTLPFLLAYYVAAVAYLSVRELPSFLGDSFLGVVAPPVNPISGTNIPIETPSPTKRKRSGGKTAKQTGE